MKWKSNSTRQPFDCEYFFVMASVVDLEFHPNPTGLKIHHNVFQNVVHEKTTYTYGINSNTRNLNI